MLVSPVSFFSSIQTFHLRIEFAMLATMHSHLFSTSIQKPHQTVVDNPEWKMVPKNLHGKRFAIPEDEGEGEGEGKHSNVFNSDK